jgi:hypothetical protein
LTWRGAAVLASVAVAAPGPLPLSARLIRNGDFVGLRPELSTQLYKTARAWIRLDPLLTKSHASAEVARLKREGFAGVRLEYLDRGPTAHSGVSWVMQLGSSASARAELGASFAEDVRASKGKASSFAVPVVPGARGYRVSAGGLFGDNVYFSDGNFLYLVGQGWSSRDKKPPTRSALIAAVQKLYARVHGR